MSLFAHKLTGIGATLVLFGTMLAGCGGMTPSNTPRPGMARQAGMTPAFIKAITPKNRMSARSADGDMAGDDDAGPTADGGLRPLPKVTPTPPPGKPSGGAAPDEVDGLLRLLRNYGYRGDRRKLQNQVTAVTHQYAMAWDGRVNVEEHFNWWKPRFDGVANTPTDYKEQAIYLAQHKFDVVYYVWVSKQRPSELANGRTPPMVDFNEELPIVKGIQDEGLMVQISPRGTIVDYLNIPTEFLNDYNHLFPIPQSMY